MIRTKARACDGKTRHDSRGEALVHQARLARAGASYHRLQAYNCRHCNGWHIGHRPKPRGSR